MVHTTTSRCLVLAAAALLPSSARAQGAATRPDVRLDYRYLLSQRSDLLLDDEGTLGGGRHLGEHRLRARVGLLLRDSWKLVWETDVLHGALHGHTDDATARLAALSPEEQLPPGAFSPRELYLQYAGVGGLVRAGQMASDWGLGLLANGGGHDGEPFGFSRGGDRVYRVLWANQPLQYLSNAEGARRLTVALAGDLVDRDENAVFDDGDRAWQAVASVRWKRHRREIGAYLVRRWQTDADGDTLDASVADVFFRWRRSFPLPLSGSSRRGAVEVAGEGVVVRGHTDRVVAYNAPDGLDVLALGWALRGDLQLGDTRLRIETGYASGDDNPEDAENRRFSFDPNHRAGLVLFDEVLARRSTRTLQRVSDPGRANRPPKGADGLLTDGRLGGVTYLYPTLVAGLGHRVTAGLGLLLAWSSVTPLDPYTSFQAGGDPRTSLDRPAEERFLGTEIDGGLSWEHDVANHLALRVGVQAGVFLPAEEADHPVTRGVLLAGVRY